jgi:hypothetical protein
MAQERPLSLHPLKFDDAITDLLKIKPMPKPPRKQEHARAKPTRKVKRKSSR